MPHLAKSAGQKLLIGLNSHGNDVHALTRIWDGLNRRHVSVSVLACFTFLTGRRQKGRAKHHPSRRGSSLPSFYHPWSTMQHSTRGHTNPMTKLAHRRTTNFGDGKKGQCRWQPTRGKAVNRDPRKNIGEAAFKRPPRNIPRNFASCAPFALPIVGLV